MSTVFWFFFWWALVFFLLLAKLQWRNLYGMIQPDSNLHTSNDEVGIQCQSTHMFCGRKKPTIIILYNLLGTYECYSFRRSIDTDSAMNYHAQYWHARRSHWIIQNHRAAHTIYDEQSSVHKSAHHLHIIAIAANDVTLITTSVITKHRMVFGAVSCVVFVFDVDSICGFCDTKTYSCENRCVEMRRMSLCGCGFFG